MLIKQGKIGKKGAGVISPAAYYAAGGVIPPAPGTTWNPADKHASIVLSNSNLTATTPDFAFEIVRNTDKRFAANTAKYCVEFKLDANSNGYAAVGFDDGSTATNGQLYNAASFAVSCGGGQINANGSYTGFNAGRDLTTGDVITIGVDPVASKFYVKLNGAFYSIPSTMDPTTGAGPVYDNTRDYFIAGNLVQDTISLRTTTANIQYPISGFPAFNP
jgi:hypothetical protein